jgi:hypothetical protein
MQTLPDWVISLIGVVVGALIPIMYLIGKDVHQDRKRKQEVKAAITAELTEALEALEKLQTLWSEDHKPTRIQSKIYLADEFPIDTSIYQNLEYDLLISTLPPTTLQALRRIYHKIAKFNHTLSVVDADLDSIHTLRVKELIIKIQDALDLF